jgi:hypothetical protein
MLDKMDNIEEFVKIAEFLDNDQDVIDALQMIRKCIKKPDIPASSVNSNIVKLQGLSSQFRLLGKFYYKLAERGSETTQKKDMYMTLHAATEDLVAALKYLAR